MRHIKHWVREVLLSISFWQLILSPYLLLFLKMDWDQYGKWCLTNMGLSAVLGPLFFALIRWLDQDDN